MSDFDESLDIPIEVRKRYLERRAQDVETLRKQARENEFEEFCRVGHQLKGNAASFGYPELEKIGVDLESAGQARDLASAKRALDALEAWLETQLRI